MMHHAAPVSMPHEAQTEGPGAIANHTHKLPRGKPGRTIICYLNGHKVDAMNP